MKKKPLIGIGVCVALSLTVVGGAGLAYGADEADQEKDLPKSGVLSSTSSGGYGSRNVAEPWGTDDAGRAAAPITGSVSASPGKGWVARIFNNNNEDSYSADLSVKLYNRQGAVVKTDSFSIQLKPGQSVERAVSAPSSVTEGQLELRQWKNLSKKEGPPGNG